MDTVTKVKGSSQETKKTKGLPSRTTPWQRTIYGQPQSKANSRKLITLKNRPAFIKSDAALVYLENFSAQCPVLDPMFMEDVHVDLEIYYASRRPDLDESLILDALQKRVYLNDRQVRSKTVIGRIDRRSPRVIIRVSPLA